MKTSTHTVSMAATSLLLMSVIAACAQDWPQWRGANRDGHATGFAAVANWPAELTQQWKVTVGTGDATPALVGNKLYVFARSEGREVALCLDAATGKELWRDAYDAQDATGPAARHSGPRSSPVVADGKVVTFGVRGVVSCLDASTGKLLWRKDDFAGTWPRFFTSCSPLVTDGVCIVQVGGEEKGGVVAYNLATGDQKWQWTGDGSAYASPVPLASSGAAAVVTLTAKKVVALRVADGKSLWESAFAPQGRAYNAATPIVQGPTLIYAGSGRGTMAVKIEGAGDTLTAKELWSNPDHAVQFNSPVLKDGRIYGVSQNGDLFCLDAQSGKTLWSSPTGARGGFGSVVDAGAVLMALTPQAELVVFAPNDKEFQKLASYKVAPTDTYAHPLPAGRRIFVKDQDSVISWTLP